jgi:phage terminase small subunit
MSRGGYRPGAGRPKGSGKQVREPAFPADVKRAAKQAGLTPLEYALQIMSDPDVEPERRDRMCFLAMPFMHAIRFRGGGHD